MKYAFQTSLKALTSYEKAREWFPSHAQANCNIGVVLYQLGRVEEAVIQLRHTVEIQPMFLECRRTYAAVLNGLGRAQEANAVLQRGAQIGALQRF